MSEVPNLELNNGIEIPQLGFGVFKVDPADTVENVTTALSIGYRHVDTAQMYRNEKQVGEAIRTSGVDPSDVFVTSKLGNDRIGYDAALRGFEDTVRALGLEKVDLFLIHWPLPTLRDYLETWRAFERLYAAGQVRAIGVSNFQVEHLQRIIDECEVVPAVDQIELHPYLSQAKLRSFGAEHGIAIEAWGPIGRGALLSDERVEEIAKRYGKTPAQVVLRWHVELGNVVFPKSSRAERLRENFAIFDFELSDEDRERLSALDDDRRFGPDPDTFAPTG